MEKYLRKTEHILKPLKETEALLLVFEVFRNEKNHPELCQIRKETSSVVVIKIEHLFRVLLQEKVSVATKLFVFLSFLENNTEKPPTKIHAQILEIVFPYQFEEKKLLPYLTPHMLALALEQQGNKKYLKELAMILFADISKYDAVKTSIPLLQGSKKTKSIIEKTISPLIQENLFSKSLIENNKLKEKYHLPTIEVQLSDIEKQDSWEAGGAELVKVPIPPGGANHYVFKQKTFNVPDLTVFRIKNAILSFNSGKRTYWSIFDENQRLIDQLSEDPEPFITENIQEVDSKCAFIDDRFTITNICHFLLDKLPRLEHISNSPYDFDSVFLKANNAYTEHMIRSVGVAAPIISIPKSDKEGMKSIRFKELIVCSSSFYKFRHSAQAGSTQLVKYLRKHLKIHRPMNPHKRIFVDRRGSRFGRQILNWDEFEAILRKYKFEIVEPADLSPQEQREFFSDAGVVVGIHGAGLTNILFAPKECRVLEIFSPVYGTKSYWLLADRIGQSYTAHIGKDIPDQQFDPEALPLLKLLQRDLYVDIASFEEALQKLLHP